MRYALISPRLAVQKGDFLGSGVPYWPMELAIVASFLRDRGDVISVFDLFGSAPDRLEESSDHYLQGQPLSEALQPASMPSADVFLVYAISSMSHREVLQIVETLKARFTNAIIAVLENSQAVTSYSLPRLSREFFQKGADVLCCGEIYWNWDEIDAFFRSGMRGDVPGNLIIPCQPEGRAFGRRYQKNGSYPPPAWELFPIENYWALPYSHGPKRSRRFLPVLTSRGCPYPCDFCVVPETNDTLWRGRSPEEVVNEMLYLRDRFGVKHFQIEDLNPTVKSDRWEAICRLLLERRAGIHFAFVSGTKAETLKIEQVPLLAQAGCAYVSISPETGSPDLLKKIGKPFHHQHGLDLVKECAKHGIFTQACFLVGHPEETEKDHRESCEYLRKLVRSGLDEVAVFVVSSLAGSRLYAKGAIAQKFTEALPSFSPKGREGWESLHRRRRELIRIFFAEKLKRGPSLWLQGIRSVLGSPRTKMENLPRRAFFIYRALWRDRFFAGRGRGAERKAPQA